MISRRDFGRRAALLLAGLSAMNEAGLAQRAMVGAAPAGTVWINANEWPDGPCAAAHEVMARTLPESGRYHYQEFRDIYAAIAHSEGLEGPQVLIGAGSTEVLHIAVDLFTSPALPLIASQPTYEMPVEMAKFLGRPVVLAPLRKDYSADVHRMAEAADRAKGGLIYLCNPNNPTASVTAKSDVAWLVANLPAGAVLLVDEAYIHFVQSPEVASAIRYVKDDKDVIVARTFSKIYGMAGLRVGFGCAKPQIIAKMTQLRGNVISIVSARAAVTSLAQMETLVPERRARLIATRNTLCEWLREKRIEYIEPHANFMMIDVGRDVRDVLPRLLSRGVAAGRPFPPFDRMLRVSIGTEPEMAKFREALAAVL